MSRTPHLATIVALAAASTLGLAIPAVAATTTETVYPGDTDWHTADTRPPGTLEFAPITGPYGNSALKLSTPTGGSKVQYFTDDHSGTYLRDVTEMGYSSYLEAPMGGVALPALNIRLDRDDNGTVDAYLVYEPYQDYGNAAIVPATWQSWDAWQSGDATWWSGQIPSCSQALTCTIDELLAQYPNARILEDPVSLRSGSTPVDADFNGSFGINQGSGNPGVVGYADGLHIATSTGVDVRYDFEAHVVLSGKDACKKNGWMTSTSPVFRNQGQCVSYFAANKG